MKSMNLWNCHWISMKSEEFQWNPVDPPTLLLQGIRHVLSAPFFFNSVLPNCFKEGSGREFGQGSSIQSSTPSKAIPKFSPKKWKKNGCFFYVKHVPQKSSPRKKKSPKVFWNDATCAYQSHPKTYLSNFRGTFILNNRRMVWYWFYLSGDQDIRAKAT